MINFKNIFNADSTPIGLSSMGLSKKLENGNTPVRKQQIQQTQTSGLFASSTPNINVTSLNFNQKELNDELNNLFGNSTKLNLNNKSFIG